MTATELWHRLTPWQRATLRALDIYLNWRWTGHLQTLTETFAQTNTPGGRWACRIFDRVDPGHCQRALDHPTVLTVTERRLFESLKVLHEYHLQAEAELMKAVQRINDDQR